MSAHIRIRLLGHLTVTQNGDQVTRFRTQKTAALLGYLACFLHRSHPREELIDHFWPDSDLEAGRSSLRTALASLRRQLEPPGVAEGTVLMADRLEVRLRPESVSTDVDALEAALRRARRAEDLRTRERELSAAVALYGGPLLPGFFEDWVLRERTRLEQSYILALQDLVATLETLQEWERAIETGQRLVVAEPLSEEGHLALIRLYATQGQSSAARRQFREWERISREELGEAPSAEARRLLQQWLETPRAAPSPDRIRRPSIQPADGEREAPPGAAPQALAARSARLPVRLTRFFGREQEIQQGVAVLRSGRTRLLTLTGPGGTGKTRLALEIASQLTDHFQNYVWFVSLAEITDAYQLPETLAHALSLQREPGREPMEQILERLSYGPALLVLDNFEQLPDEAAEVVQTLLESAPELCCLVTSRSLLLIGGEQEFPVAPLPVPTHSETPEHLLAFTSVQMFVDRARAARPDFQITPANAEAIAALCIRLEGIPLAIELAAGWAQVQTPAQMLSKLNRRFDLLTSRRKDLPPRHRTLRAAVEWSYRLLPPELQSLFQRLSVFQGGFTVEAVEAICAEQGKREEIEGKRNADPSLPSILDLLAQLRERSLIVTQESGDMIRYALLETLREYAQEQLPEAARPGLMARHRDYFVAFAEKAEPQLLGHEQLLWLERLEREQENFRVALQGCLSPRDPETGLRLGAALATFWVVRGYAREGLHWLELFLEQRAPVTRPTLAKALSALATVQELFGDWGRVIALYEQSLDIYRQLGDKSAMADVLVKMHNPLYFYERNITRAASVLEQSLALYREVGNIEGIARTLVSQGNLVRDQGNHTTAASLYEQSLALYRQIGNRQGISHVLAETGYMLTAQQEFARATAALEEAIALSREVNNKIGIAHTLWLLGRVKEMQREYAAAEALFQEAITFALETGNRLQVFNATSNLGILADLKRDYPTGLKRHAEALVIAREMGNRWMVAYALIGMARMEFFMGHLLSAQDLFLQSLCILRDGGALHRIASVLLFLAQIAAKSGRSEQAVRLLGALQGIEQSMDWTLLPEGWTNYETDIEEARTVLGDAEYERIRAEGRQASLQEILEELLV